MRYAVIDIEWFNKPFFMISQIGGIMFDGNHKELSRIYHTIKTDVKPLKKEMEQFGFEPDMFEKAIGRKRAMKDFNYWLCGCNKVILWSKETEEVLKKLFETYKPSVYPDIVVVNSEYKACFNYGSFKKHCKRYGIKIDKPMHIAINDCEYLSKLYRIVSDETFPVSDKKKLKSEDEQRISDLEISPYRAIDGSGVFHHKECHYVKNSDVHKLIPLFNYCHADVLGYTPCKCCKPASAVQHTDIVKWDFEGIKQYCRKLKIDCKVRNDLIYIITPLATWFFFTNRMYIILYHENHNKKTSAQKSQPKMFHIQSKTFTDPMDAIFYIYCHDLSAEKCKRK